jgi:hypothetical protein
VVQQLPPVRSSGQLASFVQTIFSHRLLHMEPYSRRQLSSHVLRMPSSNAAYRTCLYSLAGCFTPLRNERQSSGRLDHDALTIYTGCHVIMMCLVHAIETPAFVAFQGYAFFVSSGAWTTTRAHGSRKLLVRAVRMILSSIAVDAVQRLASSARHWTNVLRCHAGLLILVALERAFFGEASSQKASHRVVSVSLLLMITLLEWKTARIGTCLTGACIRSPPHPFGDDVCVTVSESLAPRRCMQASLDSIECMNTLEDALGSTSIGALSQWQAGYVLCPDRMCECTVQKPAWADVVFGPMALVPCAAAFEAGRLYGTWLRGFPDRKLPIYLLMTSWWCVCLAVALADASLHVDDLFHGDAMTTTLMVLTAVLHLEYARSNPLDADDSWVCRRSVSVFARNALLAYSLQPLLSLARSSVLGRESSVAAMFLGVSGLLGWRRARVVMWPAVCFEVSRFALSHIMHSLT